MLPCFKLSRIPKQDVFDSKKLLVIFTVILCSTAPTSILSGVRYVCEQTWKVTWFSCVVFLFFLQLNITTWFLQDTFFCHFETFTKNYIVMPGSTICLYIDRKERTLFTGEPNFTARQPFLAEKRRIKTCYYSLWLAWWSLWRRVAYVKHRTFYF